VEVDVEMGQHLQDPQGQDGHPHNARMAEHEQRDRLHGAEHQHVAPVDAELREGSELPGRMVDAVEAPVEPAGVARPVHPVLEEVDGHDHGDRLGHHGQEAEQVEEQERRALRYQPPDEALDVAGEEEVVAPGGEEQHVGEVGEERPRDVAPPAPLRQELHQRHQQQHAQHGLHEPGTGEHHQGLAAQGRRQVPERVHGAAFGGVGAGGTLAGSASVGDAAISRKGIAGGV
jgi:hypothetical protein